MFNLKRVRYLEARVIDLTRQVQQLENSLYVLESLAPAPLPLQVGDNVRGSESCGFNKAMTGKVVFIQPDGILWVLRKGASGPVMYSRHELVLS